jgi:heme oxygenase
MSLDTSSVSPTPTAMQKLRNATRRVHAGVEDALPLLDPTLSRARYVEVVQAFQSFYAVLEPRISAVVSTHDSALGIADRAKLPLLARDLVALSAEPVRMGLSVRIPDVHTPSHAIGALYVIEGATLGGQIIGKHLRDRLGIGATTGAAFFTGYAEATRGMWCQFTDHVDHRSELDLQVAIETAIETFVTMTHWFATALAAS